MSKQETDQPKSAGSPTVFVGAHIPLRLYRLLVQEARQAGVCQSEVLRRALADRYEHQPGASDEEKRDEV